MKSRNILYIVISIICVAAIVIAVYYEIFGKDKKPSINTNNNLNSQIEEEIDLEQIKSEFNSIFNNKLNTQGNEIANVQKINEQEEIVYCAYAIKEEKEGKYSVNINVPVFNIKGDIANEFNQTTQTIFANKASQVLTKAEFYTIYNVEYVAYINENILSLVIKSTLKEGNSAQRVIVQTYNYNLETGEKVDLNNVLQTRNVDKEQINKKIEKQVSYAAKQAELISQATLQSVYKRDLNNAMYLIDNVDSFFIGENGKIYIVYAYGNSNFTSEIDIILF